jgi:hypothetical protein
MSTRTVDKPKVASSREEWLVARTADAARDHESGARDQLAPAKSGVGTRVFLVAPSTQALAR